MEAIDGSLHALDAQLEVGLLREDVLEQHPQAHLGRRTLTARVRGPARLAMRAHVAVEPLVVLELRDRARMAAQAAERPPAFAHELARQRAVAVKRRARGREAPALHFEVHLRAARDVGLQMSRGVLEERRDRVFELR